jgi:hypothetical protein
LQKIFAFILKHTDDNIGYMHDKIIKSSKTMFIFTILVSTQFVITTNLTSAYGTSEWDSHGKIMPDGKKAIKGLEHHKTVAKHSIPFRKYAEANTVVIPARQQVIANITSSRNFTMTGIINGIGYDNVTPPDVQVAVGPANVM